MYTQTLEKKIDDRLLATHVACNPEFETACAAGDGVKIMAIVRAEMEKNNLFTKGSKKFHDDVLKMLRGKEKVSSAVGSEILFFAWNSRFSGLGYSAN